MAEVSLNTEDEREEGVQSPAVAPPPQIQPVDETPVAPEQPRPANIEGLARDPYSKASEQEMRGLFQYRPEVLGFTKEPLVPRADVPVGSEVPTAVGALDEITAEQERLLGMSSSFFTLDLQERAFPPDATMEQKYRILLRNEGGYLPQLDESGQEVRTEGSLNLFPLSTTREYERYTTEFKPQNIVETAGEVAREAISMVTGPTGRGDLMELDQKLKDLGMDNQIARTLALRGVATGRYEGDIVTKQLQDLKVFALSVPKMAVELTSFLTTEVVMNALEAGGLDYKKGPEGQTAQENVKRQFQSLADFADIAKNIGVETTIENMSGDIYNPDVIEEILAPRGIKQSIQAYAGPELALYAVWGTYKAVTAARRMPALQKYMKETYGSEDLIEAFNNARVAGKSQNAVIREYVETQTGDKAQKKLAKDLDIAFGMMVRRPGEARREFLQGEYNAIGSQINTTLETIRAARATGKTDVVKRQQKVLKGLRQQKMAFLHRNMVPKYYRDLYAEAGMTVGATVAFTQLSQQFFGFKQSEMMPIEIGGALSAAIPLGRFGTSADLAGAGIRATGGIIDEIANVVKNIGDMDAIKSGRAELKLTRDATSVLRKVAEQPTEFQTQFIEGLKRHSEYKNRLVELSARTGVEINENLMVSNLAIMSGMAELIDISRQLDEKLTATGFEDITGPIIQRREVISGQQELITQLAISTQRLLDIKLQANLADDDPLSIMADQMREFVLSNQQRLKDDRGYLTDIVEKNTQALKAAMEVDYIDGEAAQATTTSLLSEQFTDQIDAVMNDMSDDVRGLVLEPQKGVAERLARLDELREEQFQMINQINRGLRPDEAATGRAGGHFANIVAWRRSLIDGEVAKRYIAFDTKHPKVHANVSNQFEYLMETAQEDFDSILDPDYVLNASKELRGVKIIPKDRKGFAKLFNGAAKRGLEMMNARTDGQMNRILETLELSDAQPIQQWMELKRLAREEPETLGLDAGDAQALVDNIPMLVNTKEWREVNKYLGKMIRTGSKEKGDAYKPLYDQWQLVGRSTAEDGTMNRGAWMEGWLDSPSPKNVADEVYAEFRSIQDYYNREVIERYTVDSTIRGWDATLTGKTKGAAVGPASPMEGVTEDELLQDFLKTFSRTDDANMPTQWLNQLLTRVREKTKEAGVPLSGMDFLSDNLYSTVAGTLGKIGGVYDQKTGQYFLLGDSALADDKYVVEATKQLQNVITRHLQGVLVSSFDNVLPKDAKGRLLFTPNMKLDYDKQTFDTLFNIPVYTRNEAGDVVPLIRDGQPVMLLDKEEVYSSINLDALERNRIDLQDTFDEANDYVNSLEDEIIDSLEEVGPKGEPMGIEALAKEEIKFIEELQYELLGMRPGQTTSYLSKTEADERIFNMFIERDGTKELERIRQNLMTKGYSEEYIDGTIARAVNEHITTKTQVYVGNKEVVGADGVKLKKPQYEVSSREIINIIGEPGSATRRRLETLLGEDAVESWELIADVIQKVDPPPANSGIDAHVSSMSLDSVLSRIYNINRGVVSVQWVATESIIRASRQHSGALLRAMLKDKDVARKVLEIIETNTVPEYKVEPKWLRVLMSEVVMAEVRNENASTDTFASAYYDFTEFPETPETRTQAAPQGASADVAAIADRNERLAAIDQIDDPRERAKARMDLMGVGEATPEEDKKQLSAIERDFQSLGLSTKQFQNQGATP